MEQQARNAFLADEPNVLELKATEYLSWLNRGEREPWRPRNLDETEVMRRATRRGVAFAGLAGIISGGLIGGGEVLLRFELVEGFDELDFREQLPWWVGFFVFAGVISAVEIAFLYVTAIRGIATLTHVSDVVIEDGGDGDLIARGLARAALEFPNPRGTVFGIDPYAYVPRWRLLAVSVAYKLKVGVTSFILRVFLRRVAARMAVRGLVPLVAGPLYAAWNAFIIWRIMHEARIRALGPFAVEGLVDRVAAEAGSHSDDDFIAVLWSCVGEMVMRNADAHPNHVFLLARLRRALHIEKEGTDCHWPEVRSRLARLGPTAREQILSVLALAAIIGSNVRGSQRDLLSDACEACELPFRRKPLRALRDKMKEGRELDPEDYRSIWASQ